MLDEEFHLALSNNSTTRKFAYHGWLISRLRNIIKKVVAIDNQSEIETDRDNESLYLHIKQLKIYDANLLPCPYVSGLPSVMALWGFVHNFELNVIKSGIKYFKIDSVAWFIHNQDYEIEQRLSEPNKVNPLDKTHQVNRAGNRTGVWGNFVCDVIIKLKTSDFFNESLLTKENLIANVPNKFCGGNLFFGSKAQNKILISASQVRLFQSLARLPASGYWIYPSTSKFSSETELITILNDYNQQKLTLCGYQFLEEPRKRENSHADEHVYAEPALGLVNCVNAIDVRINGIASFFSNAFWTLNEDSSSLRMVMRG